MAFNISEAAPDWLNKGDNAWQMISATLVGIQSVPGLVILYGSIVKKKWAVNSAFMALYAFAAVLICWVCWAYKMSFGEELLPFWGKPGFSLGQNYLLAQAELPESTQYDSAGGVATAMAQPYYPMASLVYFQFVFAAITLILLAGSLLGRMNFKAWVVFVPLWLTFSYTVGAFSMWGGGFLFHWGVMDYAGGYVIHLSSGIAGLTAAYWVGPRTQSDREDFTPNNILLTLMGAGLLWMGWSGFNGGAPYAVNLVASMAVLNTHICAATSLVVWTCMDVIYFNKPSVIGAIQGMITGLVCITPGAGLVQGWAALIMGIFSGSIPWFTMMILHKRSKLLQKVDDTLGMFHTHAVAGLLGGICTGIFAEPKLSRLFLPVPGSRGLTYGGPGGMQLVKQLVAAAFIIGLNVVVTSIICLAIRVVIPLRMSEEQLLVGDDAVHGEEAYALWGDGKKFDDLGSNKYDEESI
ncbi:hypothetical protein MKW92_027196 [Papaver armeniacum]|nr:hypothetical protein MKW92_027196 [Papaver armeniacum]